MREFIAFGEGAVVDAIVCCKEESVDIIDDCDDGLYMLRLLVRMEINLTKRRTPRQLMPGRERGGVQ